jgi:hypothetical protein
VRHEGAVLGAGGAVTTLARAFVETVVAEHLAGQRTIARTVSALVAPGASVRGAQRPKAGKPAAGTTETTDTASSLARRARKAAEAKGRRLQRLMRDYYVAQGCRVEVARKAVVWYFNAALGKRTFAQVRHDYFGLWDLCVVDPDGQVSWCQVTTLTNVYAKRAKILANGFPASRRDIIAGHEKGRTFRVLRGPAFAVTSERLEVGR